MLIETLFLRLFEPDQSEIEEIVQEIVNIHYGAIFKNGTKRYQHLAMLSSYDSFLVVRYSCNIWYIKHVKYLCELKQAYFVVLLVLSSVLFGILQHKLVVSLNTLFECSEVIAHAYCEDFSCVSLFILLRSNCYVSLQ